jgi:membrane protein implicated in regulation of membrane protease activity
MIKRGWSRHAVGKYTALQVPAAVLAGLVLWLLWRYQIMPAWLAWCLLLLWILKDVVLFFYVWPAYEPSGEEGPLSPVGQVGVVEEDMEKERMRVRVRGETWRAMPEQRLGKAFRSGQSVRVVDRRGLVLIVRPILTEEKFGSFV